MVKKKWKFNILILTEEVGGKKKEEGATLKFRKREKKNY